MKGILDALIAPWKRLNQEVPRHLGVRDPHPFEESVRKTFYIILPKDFSESLTTLEDIVLFPEYSQDFIPHNSKMVPVNITFWYIYMVPQKQVKRGCHGQYSLIESVKLEATVGGDPQCGGGIKKLFAPQKNTDEAKQALNEIITQPEFFGLMAWTEPLGKYDQDNLDIFLGNIGAIGQYFKYAGDPCGKYPDYLTEEDIARIKTRGENSFQIIFHTKLVSVAILRERAEKTCNHPSSQYTGPANLAIHCPDCGQTT